MKDNTSWNVSASYFAKKTFNPIRNIMEKMVITPDPDKQMIALSIGDPTVFGNLSPSPVAIEAVVESVRSGNHNGYIPSTGTPEAKEAIAEYMSFPGAPVDAKDVIICSGCSSALDMCISAICDRGKTILVPKPGFPLYSTLAEGFGCSSRSYDLMPDKNWLVDIDHLESLIDSTTVAIIVNNPSNPCGSVFPREHLEDIAAVAIKHKIPIIADEIYDHFVFEGQEFHPIASVNPDLPVLACGGLTKRFVVPGWRTGWIAIHDRGGVLHEISEGLRCLSQRIIGSNTVVQGALPTILRHTPQSFFDATVKQVQDNAQRCYSAINQIPGLTPVLPQGAMYMMVGINMEEFTGFSSDLEFVERLVAEQSVFCLPGKCFNYPNFFRVVLTVPEEKMMEACMRMREFCEEHHVTASNGCEESDSSAKRVKLHSTLSDESSDDIRATDDRDDSNSVENVKLHNGKTTEPHEHQNRTNGVESSSTHNDTKNHSTDTEHIHVVEKGIYEEHSDNIHDGFTAQNDMLHSDVSEMQSALIKECAIRDKDELIDEMEFN